ncbi:MAG: hypothetical protein ACM3QS_09285 [Bacteroidota bacterium]
MANKQTSRNRTSPSQQKRSAGTNVLLTLTLVPLVVGLLLIGAWALDYLVLEDAQSQLIVGVLFFLLSFAASNALQRRWRLAAGWSLLICSDLVLLAWLNLWAQIAALIFGLVGLGLIVVEFFRQYQRGKAGAAGK